MKVNQETISVKSALVMNFSKGKSNFAVDQRKNIEIPYNLMACLHTLKLKQKIEWIAEFDVKNKMYNDVDELGEAIYQRGVRATLSDNVKEAYTDVKSQNIELQEKAADHYLTGVLSSVYRLPPFDFTPLNGYSFLNVRYAGKIMFYPELGLYVVSIATMLTQMVFLLGNTDQESHINDVLT